MTLRLIAGVELSSFPGSPESRLLPKAKKSRNGMEIVIPKQDTNIITAPNISKICDWKWFLGGSHVIASMSDKREPLF